MIGRQMGTNCGEMDDERKIPRELLSAYTGEEMEREVDRGFLGG